MQYFSIAFDTQEEAQAALDAVAGYVYYEDGQLASSSGFFADLIVWPYDKDEEDSRKWYFNIYDSFGVELEYDCLKDKAPETPWRVRF